jgi:predicted TIM-barrel fold metal-dependent hydrolase
VEINSQVVADRIRSCGRDFSGYAASIAADELEHAVVEDGLKGALISGTIDGKFLDAPEFAPVLARAERLDVPLYIHPGREIRW